MSITSFIPFGTRLNRNDHASRIATALSASFAADEITAIDQLGTMISISAGTSLMLEDTTGGEALVVVEGRASVKYGDTQIATVGAGGILGEGALLNSRRRNATVTADTEMTLIALTGREFASVLARCPSLGQRVRSIDAARQAELG